MLEFISVTLVSTAGWLISLRVPHSAARRHLILTSALGACLLLPMALIVRSAKMLDAASSETMRRNTIDPIRTSAIGERAPLIDHASASEAAARTPHAEGVTPGNDSETIRSSPTIPDLSATAIARPEQLAPQNRTAVPRRTWQTSAAHWGRTVYAVVAAILLIRLLFGLTSVLRLKRVADAIDSFADGIPVLEANIAIPLAIGFGKPVIVLPRGFAATVTPNELHDVLAHEAEHLWRRDHWTILLERLIATAYWPVVTVHLLNRALDRAREELCDNAVIRERDPESYGHTLLVVARQVGVRNPSLSQWATSMIGQGELERRVAGLLDRRRDRRTRISRYVRWTTTATLLVLCGLAGNTRRRLGRWNSAVEIHSVRARQGARRAESHAAMDGHSQGQSRESDTAPRDRTWTGRPSATGSVDLRGEHDRASGNLQGGQGRRQGPRSGARGHRCPGPL